jgi:hypothetical protein
VGKKTNAHKIAIGKPEGKKRLGRPVLGSIKTDVKEIDFEGPGYGSTAVSASIKCSEFLD